MALVQGLWLKWRAPRFGAAAGPKSGLIAVDESSDALRFLALGDSVIAGVGLAKLSDAMAVQCALAISRQLRRSVHWQLQGENGARAAEIQQRCPDLAEFAPQIILISVGVNNVTSMQSIRQWRTELQALTRHLQQGAPHAHQIYLGVPPMAQFPLLTGVLRRVLGERATRFDIAMQEMLAPLPYALHVPISAPAADGFADDGYHPSSASCQIFAAQLAQTYALSDL